MFFSFILPLLVAGATGAPTAAAESPALPPAQVELRIDAPDPAGPWKMVVTNKGDVPVRFGADGRLLTLEVPKPEDPYAKKKPKTPPPPLVCKLPAEMRPTGIVEERALVLPPGGRYEEVISPALYCFGDKLASALVPGTQVVAKLGFTPPAKPKKNAPPAPPFIVEPAVRNPTMAPMKELVSEPFTLPAASPTAPPASAPGAGDGDPNGPALELVAPTRVDTQSELTVGMTLTLKNTGGRSTLMHLRRDNLMFDIDGPDGSAHCGQPAERRRVPRDAMTTFAAGSSRTIDVWIGEMCPDYVFDRPGLYRVRPSVGFPTSSDPTPIKAWSQPVSAKEPALVRVREGHLPFYASPPQVLGGAAK